MQKYDKIWIFKGLGKVEYQRIGDLFLRSDYVEDLRIKMKNKLMIIRKLIKMTIRNFT